MSGSPLLATERRTSLVVRFVPIAFALSILWAEIGAVNAAPAFLVGVNNNLSNIATQNPVDKVSGTSK
jgi:hypothetical protein